MAIYNVSTVTDLVATAKLAVAGDIIRVAPGSYSGTQLKAINPAGGITITSADPANPAIFNDLTINSSSNITLSHVTLLVPNSTVFYPFQVLNSSNVTLSHTLFDGPGLTPIQSTTGLIIRNSSGVTVTESEFKNLVFGLTALDNNGVTISNSHFHDLRSDGVRFGGSSNVLVENNFFTNFHPQAAEHADAIQFWTTNTTASVSNITVSGNAVVRGVNGSPIQGIFIRDEFGTLKYQNVTITDNIVLGGLYNGITLDGVASGTVSRNTVIGFTDQDSWIRTLNNEAALSVSSNIATRYVTQIDETLDNSLAAALTDAGLATLSAWSLGHIAPGGLGDWAAILQSAGLVPPSTTTLVLAPVTVTPTPPAANELYGTSSNDTLVATTDKTVVFGLDGNDQISGNAGNSRLEGGKGDDTYTVTAAGDRVVERANEGNDRIISSIDFDLPDNIEILTLTGLARRGNGNAGNNVLNGTSSSDTLDGRAGDDTLFGGGGNDMLTGGDGNDQIDGGTNNDRLSGGAGYDTFVFRKESIATRDADEIMDFARGYDKIDLRGIDAIIGTTADEAFRLIGSKNFSKRAGELQAKAYGDGILVSGDVNGDGFADFSIHVHGITKLAAGDFFL